MPNEEMKVLVIEDEESFITALKVGLTREGFTVEVQSDGAEALNTFKTFNPDIVLLDLMLPNRSGVDICRDIREIAKTPIIMVTAKSEEIDTVLGLEVGADDYISKPYRLHELIARMRAQLRRANWGDEPVGKLKKGNSIYKPIADALNSEYLSSENKLLVSAKLQKWLDKEINEKKLARAIGFSKWQQLSDEDFYIIREKDIITVSSMNKEVIFMYEAYVHGADGFGKPRPQMKTDLSKTSGYVGRIDEARKKFEKIFKDSTESP
mgnify:CR=1 FL=1